MDTFFLHFYHSLFFADHYNCIPYVQEVLTISIQRLAIYKMSFALWKYNKGQNSIHLNQGLRIRCLKYGRILIRVQCSKLVRIRTVYDLSKIKSFLHYLLTKYIGFYVEKEKKGRILLVKD